ncbi:hypothetical protein AMTR_s00010p00069010 [Amborella trichopoda]|uniref:Uncharacterized protein n=1 Tax=Amborella trichopoda TaxID=13333 RepID=W1NF16_AMBTC|nr:hypothetical protein AMTR_s00010p00069010 [Amborella trichopoda]
MILLQGVKRGSVRLHSKTLVEFLKNGEVGSKAKTGKSLGVVPKGSFVVVSRRSLHGKHEPVTSDILLTSLWRLKN